MFGEVAISFPVRSTMPVKRTAEVSLAIDNSLVDSFNALHGTEYISIDPNFITIENSTLHIEEGELESSEQIGISLAKDKTTSLALGDYLIPVKINQVSNGFEVSEEWSTMYVRIKVSEDPWGIDLADRTGWSVKEVSSEETVGEDGRAVLALDGNNNTFWHTEWYYNSPEPPYNIVIDMGKEMKMFGFQYISRNNWNGWPKEMKIETSLNGTTWEDAGLYSDLPSGAQKEYRSFFPNLEIRNARYFRMTITQTHGDTDYTAVAEINALAIE